MALAHSPATIRETITDPWTAVDLLRLPDDGHHYELMEGELFRISPTSIRHGRYATRFGGTIERFVDDAGIDGIVGTEIGFLVARDPDTVLAPDIAFISADRLPPDADLDSFAPVAPDLAVEIVSPSDRGSEVLEKVLLYLDAGTRLVWVLLPKRTAVMVYGPDRVGRILTADDILEGGDALPGFRIRVADIFR